MAAVLNFVGAFISLAVAATIASGIVQADAVTPTIVFAGLIGAIAWNLITWYMGLPSSSSHALIGGVVGAAAVAEGFSVIDGEGIVSKVAIPALIAPLVAFAAAGGAILFAYRIIGRLAPGGVNRGFRLGQLVTGSLFSLAHGTNDAQKTMGIITLALIASGELPATGFEVPEWVVVSSATAIALGTWFGGWRIIRTMGSRIIRMDPPQGFSAQGAGSAVILAASHFGYPLSTTHTISGGIVGAGAAKRLSAVRWGIAGQIVMAWVLTLPAAAAVGAAYVRGHARVRQRRARAPARRERADARARRVLRPPRPGAPARGAGSRRVMAVLAAIVDVDALGSIVLASLGFGIGGTAVFALAVLSVTRFAEARQAGAHPRAIAYAVATALTFAGFFGAVALGLVVMTAK